MNLDLWIRSQDKECLMKVDRLDYDLSNYEHRIMVNGYATLVAKYPTKKRALEILDEIKTKIKNQYIVKANVLAKQSDMMKEKQFLEEMYAGDFIMQPPPYEIVPVNQNIIYYEMPTK